MKAKIITALATKARRYGCRVIPSAHYFKGTPKAQELLDIVRCAGELLESSQDLIFKVVAMILSLEEDVPELTPLLDIADEYNLAVFGMGALGEDTRYDFIRRNSLMIYGAFDDTKPAAPGQPSLKKMIPRLKELYPNYRQAA